jgi:hypothetical protein
VLAPQPCHRIRDERTDFRSFAPRKLHGLAINNFPVTGEGSAREFGPAEVDAGI